MNPGSNPPDPQPNSMALVPSAPPLLDPETFRINMAFIESAKAKLAMAEEQTWASLRNYEAVRKLQEEAERGRRAQELLASMDWNQLSSSNNSSLPNPAGQTAPAHSYPSSSLHAFHDPLMDRYQQQAYNTPRSPPHARIEEVPSGSPSNHPPSQISSAVSSNRAEYGASHGNLPRSTGYAQPQRANINVHPQNQQQRQVQRRDSTYNTVDPRRLQVHQTHNNQLSVPAQHDYSQRRPNDNISVSQQYYGERGYSSSSQMAPVQSSPEPQQSSQQQQQRHVHTAQHALRSPVTSYTTHIPGTATPPLPPYIDTSRLNEKQFFEAYNRYSGSSSSLAGALGDVEGRSSNLEKDEPAPGGTSGVPQSAPNPSRATASPLNQHSNTTYSRPQSAASQTSSASAQRLAQLPVGDVPHPSHPGARAVQPDGMNTVGNNVQIQQHTSGNVTRVKAVQAPNTVLHSNGSGTSQLSFAVQSASLAVPNVGTNTQNHPPTQSSRPPVVNIAGYQSSAQPTSSATYVELARALGLPLPSSAPRPHVWESHTQARVPSGVSGSTEAANRVGTPDISGPQTNGAPHTPEQQRNRPTPLTPASANRRSLAKSILRALGPPSKRKADEPRSPSPELDEPPLKRQATGRPSPDVTEFSQMQSAVEIAQETTIMPIATPSGVNGATPVIVASQELTVQHSTTERDVQDLMEAFAHAVPEPPVESLASLLPDTSPVENEVNATNSTQPTQGPSSVNPENTAPAAPSDTPLAADKSQEQVDLDTALASFQDSEMPLFLPSPELLPSAGPSMRIMDLRKEMAGSLSKGEEEEWVDGPNLNLRVYVEVLTVKAWLLQRSKSSAKGKGKDIVSQLDVPITEAEKQKQSTAAEATAPTTEDERRKQLALNAAKVASSRLRRRPCSWKDCSYVLNTGEKLRRHVTEHVDLNTKVAEQSIFPCRWDGCDRRFRKPEVLLQHLQSHVRRNILCSFRDCEEAFDHPMKLLSHVQGKHMYDALRPSAHPFEHFPPARMPALPEKMYAYHTVHMPIQQARIPKERHERLGPWVYNRIFGPVNFDYNQSKARYLMRARDLANKPVDKSYHTSFRKNDRCDAFTFLLKESSHPVTCDDLDSAQISRLVETGLAFLPDENGPQGPLEELVLTSLMQSDVKEEEVSLNAARMLTPQQLAPSQSSATPIRREENSRVQPQSTPTSHTELVGSEVPHQPAPSRSSATHNHEEETPQIQPQSALISHTELAEPEVANVPLIINAYDRIATQSALPQNSTRFQEEKNVQVQSQSTPIDHTELAGPGVTDVPPNTNTHGRIATQPAPSVSSDHEEENAQVHSTPISPTELAEREVVNAPSTAEAHDHIAAQSTSSQNSATRNHEKEETPQAQSRSTPISHIEQAEQEIVDVSSIIGSNAPMTAQQVHLEQQPRFADDRASSPSNQDLHTAPQLPEIASDSVMNAINPTPKHGLSEIATSEAVGAATVAPTNSENSKGVVTADDEEAVEDLV